MTRPNVLIEARRLIVTEFRGKKYADFHGSPFDRGGSDSYYRRPRNPHWCPDWSAPEEANVTLGEITKENMTPEEIEAYHAGYDHNEEAGYKKEADYD